MTTAPLLYSSDKDFEETQQIITSIEATKLAKHVTGQIADLVIMTKKK